MIEFASKSSNTDLNTDEGRHSTYATLVNKCSEVKFVPQPRLWAELLADIGPGRSWHKSANVRPKSAESGPSLVQSAEFHPKSVEVGPNSGDPGPIESANPSRGCPQNHVLPRSDYTWTEVGRCWGQNRPMSTKCGPGAAKVAPVRPMLGNIWPAPIDVCPKSVKFGRFRPKRSHVWKTWWRMRPTPPPSEAEGLFTRRIIRRAMSGIASSSAVSSCPQISSCEGDGEVHEPLDLDAPTFSTLTRSPTAWLMQRKLAMSTTRCCVAP